MSACISVVSEYGIVPCKHTIFFKILTSWHPQPPVEVNSAICMHAIYICIYNYFLFNLHLSQFHCTSPCYVVYGTENRNPYLPLLVFFLI